MLLPLLLVACQIEQEIKPDGDDPDGGFDTGSTVDTEVDTDDDSTSVETGTTGEACPDQVFPGYAIPLLPECDGTGATPAWSLSTTLSLLPGATSGTPVFANLTDDDGDGVVGEGDIPDVVVDPYLEGVYVYSGDDGRLLWSVAGGAGLESTTPAIGDLDGDGFPEVIIAGLTQTVALHGADGSVYWVGPADASIKAACGATGAGDLDGDGLPEVYFGRMILDGQTGALRGSGTAGFGTGVGGQTPMSVAADLDLDGRLELVVGNAVYDADGDTLWALGPDDGYPAVGNFDGDPEGEVVIGNTLGLTLQDTDGTRLWRTDLGGLQAGPPAIADIDGDGDPEILVGVIDGVYAVDGDGTVLWRFTGEAGFMFDGPSAYDLDGDGAWEVLVNSAEHLRILDGRTGATLAEQVHPYGYTCGGYASAADVDGDGDVEIGYAYRADGGYGGVVVVDDGDGFVAGPPIWNAHDYSITNVSTFGVLPATADPNWRTYNNFRAGPPPPPGANLRPVLVDVCVDGCAEGELVAWVQLGNDGPVAVEGDIQVDLYGVTDAGDVLLGSALFLGGVDPGWMSPSESIEVRGAPTPLYDLIAVVDGGDGRSPGVYAECDEADNEDGFGGVVCP